MNATRHLKSEFSLNRLVQTTIHVKSADTPEPSEKYGLTLSTAVFLHESEVELNSCRVNTKKIGSVDTKRNF